VDHEMNRLTDIDRFHGSGRQDSTCYQDFDSNLCQYCMTLFLAAVQGDVHYQVVNERKVYIGEMICWES